LSFLITIVLPLPCVTVWHSDLMCDTDI
jgi:hypothetical protein